MTPLDTDLDPKLFPLAHCSLCGNPCCETMARRVLHRLQSPGDCPLLSREGLERLEKVLAQVKPPGVGVTTEPGVTTFQPCAEYDRITVETTLTKPSGSNFQVFDPGEMCSKLKLVETLKNQRCSGEMGYGFAGYDDTHLHIFKTGKIIVRRALSKEQAVKLLKIVKGGLWPSVICWCGNVVSECVGGGCDHCLDMLCPGVEWGLKETGRETELKKDQKVFFEIISHPERCNNQKFLVATWSHVNKMFGDLLPGFFDGQTKEEKVTKTLEEIGRNATMAIETGVSAEEVVMGLALHGLLRDIGRISAAISKLSKAGDEYVEEARKAVEQTLMVMGDGEPSELGVDKMVARCRETALGNPGAWWWVEMYKLLSNCWYIARLMGRPIPGKPTKMGG